MNSNTVHLPIKRKWFDMILSGEKKEEYREVKPYWVRRLLCDMSAYGDPMPVVEGYYEKPEGKTTLTLTAGYGKDKPRIVIEWLNIDIGHPKPEWCEPGTTGLWFVLHLGKIIEVKNVDL